jgi:predicted DCC family thiol-disulfide oxidoreductase YuxK
MQSTLGQDTCRAYGMPADRSTGILVDEQGAHRDSTAVLRMLPYLGFPYNILGPIGLWLVPTMIRDAAFRAFTKRRGTIWKGIRRIMGWPVDVTRLEAYRDRILGLEEPLDPAWGFDTATASGSEDRSL